MQGEPIRLGQFLKLVGAVDSGAEAREVIASGLVRVDGQVETRRGRQLPPGTSVELGQDVWTIEESEPLD